MCFTMKDALVFPFSASVSSLINPVYSVYSQQSPVYWLVPGIFCVPLTL